ADFHVGAQRAEFGLGAGVQVEVGAGQPGIGVVVEQAGAAVEHVLMTAEAEDVVEFTAADADLNAQIAADLEAGLGARDVIEAGAVNVADADIFSRLRLGDDDGVGGARTGDCDQSRSGADKKALDVHFLTSSQNQNSPSPQQTGNVFPINGLRRFSRR